MNEVTHRPFQGGRPLSGKTIWKYAVPLEDKVVVNLPMGATPLTVQMQEGFPVPMIWAIVNRNSVAVPETFRWYGTDHPLPENPGIYIGTVQWERLVFHLFKDAP